MKTIRKIVISILFSLMLFLISNKVYATSISASPSNPKVGQAVTITVSVPNVNTVDLTANVSGAGTNGTIRLVDGSMTGEARTFSKSITVTPTTTGTISVSVTGGSNAVLDGEYVGVSASVNINVSEAVNSSEVTSSEQSKPKPVEKPKEVEKSKINTLKELAIEGQEISPEFNVDVREYKVTVPYDITSLNVTATPTDSKATTKIEGNEDLKEGENTITITVTAENGNETKYLIRVKRLRQPLCLNSIVVKYTSQEGEIKEISLNPTFDANIPEYTLEDIEYWVENFIINAEANLQDATVEIQGADNLVVGENIIKITARIISEEEVEEGQEPKEEIVSYTIKVNKLAEPTFMEKIKNKIKLIFGGITNWHNNNHEKIVLYSLCACIVALIGLSVYIIFDYNKYKVLVEKIKKLEQINESEQVFANIAENEDINSNQETIEDQEENSKVKRGKHF